MKINKYVLFKNKKIKPWIKFWLYLQTKIIKIVNLFNKNTIQPNHLINSNGTITEDNYNFISDYIKVKPQTKYVINAGTNKAKRVAYYKNDKTFISRPVFIVYGEIITSVSNAYYVRLSCHNDDLNSLEFYKYYDEFNIFDDELELGNYSDDGEKIAVTNIYRNKNFVEVNPESKYTIFRNDISQRYVVYYYNSNKEFISKTTSLSSGTFTTPANTYYINFRCFGADFTSDFANLDIKILKGE